MYLLVRLSLAILLPSLLLGWAIAGCRPVHLEIPASSITATPRYYDGEIYLPKTVTRDSLRVTVWRTIYMGGFTRTSGGTTLREEPGVQVYMELENRSDNTVFIQEAGESDSARPPYYLVDDKGRHYPARGRGWSYRPDGYEPPSTITPLSTPTGTFASGPYRQLLPSEGQVPPGEITEFTLTFSGIPEDVEALTLVMEGIGSADGHRYTLRIPLPLPKP